MSKPALPELPWRAMLISLGAGLILAWLVGFAAGTIVRLAFGSI